MNRWKNGSHKEEHLLESLNLYRKKQNERKKKNEVKTFYLADHISINFVEFHISNPKPEQNFYIIFYIFATDGLILVFISVKRGSVHSEG